MILINSSPKNVLKVFQPFLPITVPIGIGFLISYAKQHNIKILHVDEQVEKDTLGKTIELTKHLHTPYIFGFSVLTAAMESAVLLSLQLKRLYPDSIILFGGIHPTAVPDEVFEYPHIDLVMRSEGEKALVELYSKIKNGQDYTDVDNISYRKDGKIIHNSISTSVVDISQDVPFPYHLFTNPKYDLGFVMSSRGCPYNCIFCSNRITTGKKYRYRSAEVIVNELEILHYRYGKVDVGFFDDNFLVSKPRIYELIELIKSKGLHEKMQFGFQCRGDNVDKQILQDLFNAGFKNIFFGIETASPHIMKLIKKGETVEQCITAVKMAKKIGYKVSATFIYALPGDSHEDRMKSVELSNKLELNLVRYNNATPYPGTELFKIAKNENRLNIQGLYNNFSAVNTFTESPFHPVPFAYVPINNTEEEIRRDILYSYFRFYLNFNRFKQVSSKTETNAGWFNVGKNVSEIIKKIPAIFSLGFILFIKFIQLFYLSVIKKSTRISFKFFFSVFNGLKNKG